MIRSGGDVTGDLMIGKVSATTTIGDYAEMPQNIARVGPGDGSPVNRLPTWKP